MDLFDSESMPALVFYDTEEIPVGVLQHDEVGAPGRYFHG
jgi:hypothetical protein